MKKRKGYGRVSWFQILFETLLVGIILVVVTVSVVLVLKAEQVGKTSRSTIIVESNTTNAPEVGNNP